MQYWVFVLVLLYFRFFFCIGSFNLTVLSCVLLCFFFFQISSYEHASSTCGKHFIHGSTTEQDQLVMYHPRITPSISYILFSSTCLQSWTVRVGWSGSRDGHKIRYLSIWQALNGSRYLTVEIIKFPCGYYRLVTSSYVIYVTSVPSSISTRTVTGWSL